MSLASSRMESTVASSFVGPPPLFTKLSMAPVPADMPVADAAKFELLINLAAGSWTIGGKTTARVRTRSDDRGRNRRRDATSTATEHPRRSRASPRKDTRTGRRRGARVHEGHHRRVSHEGTGHQAPALGQMTGRASFTSVSRCLRWFGRGEMPAMSYGRDAQPEAEHGSGDGHARGRKLGKVADHDNACANECSNRIELAA